MCQTPSYLLLLKKISLHQGLNWALFFGWPHIYLFISAVAFCPETWVFFGCLFLVFWVLYFFNLYSLVKKKKLELHRARGDIICPSVLGPLMFCIILHYGGVASCDQTAPAFLGLDKTGAELATVKDSLSFTEEIGRARRANCSRTETGSSSKTSLPYWPLTSPTGQRMRPFFLHWESVSNGLHCVPGIPSFRTGLGFGFSGMVFFFLLLTPTLGTRPVRILLTKNTCKWGSFWGCIAIAM